MSLSICECVRRVCLRYCGLTNLSIPVNSTTRINPHSDDLDSTEADTYNALSMMLRDKKLGFLVQTRRDFEISWKILIKLCRKHTVGVRMLGKLCILSAMVLWAGIVIWLNCNHGCRSGKNIGEGWLSTGGAIY